MTVEDLVVFVVFVGVETISLGTGEEAEIFVDSLVRSLVEEFCELALLF